MSSQGSEDVARKVGACGPGDDLDEMLAQVAADPRARAAYEDARWKETLLARLIQVRGARPLPEVAEAMGVTQSAVSDLERGRVDPSLSALQRYARAIDGDLQFTVHPR